MKIKLIEDWKGIKAGETVVVVKNKHGYGMKDKNNTVHLAPVKEITKHTFLLPKYMYRTSKTSMGVRLRRDFTHKGNRSQFSGESYEDYFEAKKEYQKFVETTDIIRNLTDDYRELEKEKVQDLIVVDSQVVVDQINLLHKKIDLLQSEVCEADSEIIEITEPLGRIENKLDQVNKRSIWSRIFG